MEVFKLFTDGSVNPQLKVGYGAYLLVKDGLQSTDAIENSVKTMRFEQTSSTKLELETLLWALNEIGLCKSKIIIYTDCQNILTLEKRREGFERNGYLTKKNKPIANQRLYQMFYKCMDAIEYEFVKLKGHKLSHKKDDIDRLFTLVDRASRNALREDSV